MVKTVSDSEVTVGSGAVVTVPPSEGTGPSDVVGSIGVSIVEVFKATVCHGLGEVVFAGITEVSVNVVPSDISSELKEVDVV